VAAAADGDFVVVWSSIYLVEVGNGVRVSDTGVFGQRYTSAGVGVGGEFQVNTYTTFHQRSPAVAAAADGDFVVVWTSNGQEGNYSELPGQTYDGVFGQRYTSAGVRMGDEFQVNTYTTGHQFRPAVAAAADGNFVVVWNSAGQYGGYGGMFGQRYTSAGDPLGGEFQVDRDTGYFSRPALAAAADGDFVVVREDYDGQDLGVFGQRFAFFGIETTTSSTTTVSTSSTTSSSTSTTSSTTSSSSSTTDSSLTSSTTTSSTTGPSSSTTSTSTPATTTLPGATTTMPGASTTTVTLTASTTTTVASLSTFLGRLSDALPDEVTAPDKKSHNTAKKLGKLESKASTKIGKCTDASGSKQQKLCKKARGALNKLLNAAKKANEKGSLGVPLDPIDQAVTGALTLLPA